MSGEGKLAFADSLRGLAAMAVLLSHLLGTYWWRREELAGQNGLPILSESLVPTPDWIAMLHGTGPYDLGALGVAVFFLISGFVIPFSLTRYGVKGFLLGRAWRIYPTYAAGFTFGLLALLAAGASLPPLLHRGKAWLHWLPGFHNLFNLPSIDGVIWTLDVEVMFYLWMAMLWRLTKGDLARLVRAMVLVGVALVLLLLLPGAAEVARWGIVNDPLFYVRLFCFMGIGTVLHARYESCLSLRQAWLSGGSLALSFLLIWALTPRATDQIRMVPYLAGLALFTAAFAWRGARWWQARLLAGLATLSYSLYAVHALLGYVLLTLLLPHVGPLPALAITLVMVFAMARLLHGMVERPTHDIGRQAAQRYRR